MANMLNFLAVNNMASGAIALIRKQKALWDKIKLEGKEKYLIDAIYEESFHALEDLASMTHSQLDMLCRLHVLKERSLSKEVKQLCSNFTK